MKKAEDVCVVRTNTTRSGGGGGDGEAKFRHRKKKTTTRGGGGTVGLDHAVPAQSGLVSARVPPTYLSTSTLKTRIRGVDR